MFATPTNAGPVSEPSYTSLIPSGAGGSDDSPLDCGDSKVVVEVWTGGNNDKAFAIVCATLNADGTLGAKDSSPKYSSFGEGASHNFISQCPSGQAMVGIRTSKLTYLAAAQVDCAVPPTGQTKTFGSITTSRTWDYGSGSCDAGTQSTGNADP